VARSENGVDLAAVYQLLSEVAQTVRGHSGRLDNIDRQLASHERKLDDLAVGLGDLRTAVTNYHSTVLATVSS
jgi:hypothetical protein